MPHFWNGKCNLLKANKIFFFLQNLSKFTPFASLYSDPAYGREYWTQKKLVIWYGMKYKLLVWPTKCASKLNGAKVKNPIMLGLNV